MYKNILVIAPHADDEVLGCGGIISKFSKKKVNVYVAVMTNASMGDSKLFNKSKIQQIRNECLKANKKLGVKKVFFYDFPAPKLDQYPIYKISEKIYTEDELSNKLVIDLNSSEKTKDNVISKINDLGDKILNNTYKEINKIIN